MERGRTFHKIEAARKVAVDPNCRFQNATSKQLGCEYHETTSDRYFLAESNDCLFDLIFIDGLHTFEQSLRDFCNALTRTHAKSILVIDDIFPIDIYSSLRDQRKAVEFRRAAGPSEKPHAWHGDVFKLVFMIHDFFPLLSYVSTKEGGNGQTFVWREPRQEFSPIFNSLEAISRLDWFDMHSYVECFNFCSEKVALAHALSRIRKL